MKEIEKIIPQILNFKQLLPTKNIISKTVSIHSGKMTLKATPILIPSINIGWKRSAKS